MSVKFKFVDGEFFDTFKNEPVNYSIKGTDFQKVDVSYNDFSKSFTIPATPKNNRLFKHYYNPSIIESFNPFQSNPAQMWVNGELYSTGQLTLIDIDLVNGNPKQYSIQFYSDTIDLKSALNDMGLDELQWSGISFNASSTNIRTYLQGGQTVPGTNLKYPLVSASSYLVWDGTVGGSGNGNVRQIRSIMAADGVVNRDMRPAIPVSDVMDRIFADAGYSYEVDFEAQDYYSDLYMWIENGKEFVGDNSQTVIANSPLTQLPYLGAKITFPNIQSNDSKIWSPITSTATVTPSAATNFTLTLNFISVDNDYAVGEWRYVLNGSPSSWTTIIPSTDIVTTLTGLVDGDEIYIEGRTVSGSSSYEYGTDVTLTLESVGGVSALDYFNTPAYMPTMKCTEFIRGILVTFNAIMYWDVENSKFIIKHRDQWYLDGNTHDITKYVDTKNSKIKPPTFYKKYGFEWAEGKDAMNTTYKLANNKAYGSGFYNTGMFAGDEYTNKNPFTASIWREIVTTDDDGAVSFESDIATFSPLNTALAKVESGVRLMYYNGSRTANGTYKVVDSDGVSAGDNTTYNYFTGYLVSDSNLNLAYNSEFNWENSNPVKLENNIYTNFYEDYIKTIYNPSVRRLSITAFIPYNKLKEIKPNDTIVFNNVSYLIDGITVDLTTNKAKFDLINKV